MLDADEKYFKEHGEPLFSSHMIDLSEEPVDWNLETTAKYFKRVAPMKQWLEMVGEDTNRTNRHTRYILIELLLAGNRNHRWRRRRCEQRGR